MKRTTTFFICCTVLLCLISRASAQDYISSYDARFVIQYPVGQSTIGADYRDNYYAIEELKRFFSTVDVSMIDSISIVGSSSPEGDGANNLRLSTRRAESLRNLILKMFPKVTLDMMYLSSKNDTWSEMLRLIKRDPDFPNKEHTLIILAAEQNNETRLRLVRILEYHDSYNYLRTEIFPLLRNSTTFVVFYKSDRPFVVYDTRRSFEQRPEFVDQSTSAATALNLSADALLAPNTAPALSGAGPNSVAHALGSDAPKATAGTRYSSAVANGSFAGAMGSSPGMAIKTNLLYLLGLQANLETEFYFGRRWSLNLDAQVAWWSLPQQHMHYRYANFSPEIRFWFRKNGSFTGNYIGVAIGGGLYDLSMGQARNNYEGYQGEFGTVSLTYGHMWHIKKNFYIEAGFGVGYLFTEYRRYQHLDTHNVYQGTERLHTFIPTKLKLNLVWRLGNRKR